MTKTKHSLCVHSLSMRLAEKTIELNFCAQLTRFSKSVIFWFGLTQEQEARAGFDACTKIGGRLLIFQFKASNHVLRTGARQFGLEHDQFLNLKARVKQMQRSVFYVFPTVGSTLDIAKNPNIVGQSGLMDVASMPILSLPTTSKGNPRKNRLHYVDVLGTQATIHSDPVTVELIAASELLSSDFSGIDGFNSAFRSFEDFWSFRSQLLKVSSAAVIPGPSNSLEVKLPRSRPEGLSVL